jgi:hypothetical protein
LNTCVRTSFEFLVDLERLGEKQGKHSRRQCLELLTPADRWEDIARIVHDVDHLHRPVKSNRKFTWEWLNGGRIRPNVEWSDSLLSINTKALIT